MADKPPGQSCESCRYWSHPIQNSNGDDVADCQRHPPVSIQVQLAEDDRFGSPYSGFWPETEADQWCGEYAPANPETITDGAATLARLVLLGDLTAARALADKLRE